MANSVSGIFETRLVPATVMAIQSLTYTKAALGSIYWDFQAAGGEIGQTMNVPIPRVDQSDAADIGGGPLQPSDTQHDLAQITLSNHISASFVIKSWDAVRTPEKLSELYVQPKLEAALRQCNSLVTGLFTSSNLNAYSSLTSGAASTFQRADVNKLWGYLVGNGCPTSQSGNLTFLTHPAAYANMLSDTAFYSAQVVGEDAARMAQQGGVLVPALGATIKFDQQMPTPSSKYAGVFLHRWAVAGVCAPPPSNAELGGVEETYVYPLADAPKFTFQIQMGYSLRDQGTLINIHTNVGFKIVRKDFAAYAVTA
ncbi:hypothetical protein [Aquisphaera insulae]|uniref:hypothetical protein n=1 Tax=Aquisphaera insulae TaxID=2712864 RepID=UPI0013E9B115|nr:hypothetical protein [Aquisphaera insulae]